MEESGGSFKRKQGVATGRTHPYAGVPTIEYDDCRDEKPWQRVCDGITKKGSHLYEPIKSVPCTVAILLLGVYMLLGYFTQLNEDSMPRVVRETDLAVNNSDTFCEETAWRYLRQIIGTEPRVVGTRHHLEKTRDLMQLVDSVARQARLPVRTDWQTVSNEYWITADPPHVNMYKNVSNIIALLEGESGFHSNGTIGTSLLVNCHYDSVPFALGTSDNAVFCAVMLETLAKLSKRNAKFKHNVIFLFNGAEETGLVGSHGFISHPWFRGVTSVINLDAAGMNGKPHVFQVTDPRLMNTYRREVRTPAAQGLGEKLFSTGIIPSDTDFRVWRDYGGVHGVDIAFVKWAHVYHTRYDHPDVVRTGVIQGAGNMMLEFVRGAADEVALETQIPPSPMVYYDFLYWFMVSYTLRASITIDVIFALYGLLSVAYFVWLVGFRWSTVRELLWSVLGRFVAMLTGILVTVIFVPIMVATTVQMRYMSEMWITVPMFWLPYLVGAVSASHLYDNWRTNKCALNRSLRTHQAMCATRLTLSTLLLALSTIPSVATMRYGITVPLILMSTFSVVSMTVLRYVRMPAWQHLTMEVLFSIPTIMFIMSLCLRLDSTVIPTMGRSARDTPDYTIAVLNVGLAIYASVCISGIELLFSRKRLWMVAAGVLAVCFVIMMIPFSPYRDDGPSVQRHYWFHSEIITYDSNNVPIERTSGILVTKHDAYTTTTVLPALAEQGISLSSRTDFDEDCKKYVFCNLPLYRLRFGQHLDRSLFLSTSPPAASLPRPAASPLVRRECRGDVCHMHFVIQATAHNTLTMCPHRDVNITQWSLNTPVLPTTQHNGRPVYAVIHSTGTYSDQLPSIEFNLTLNVPLSLQSRPLLDFSHHAFNIHHPEQFTDEYRRILDAMPKYFHVSSFLSIRNNYVF